MTEIVAADIALPVPPRAPEPLSEADRAALRRAVAVLERPSLAARLSAIAFLSSLSSSVRLGQPRTTQPAQ